LGGARDPAVAGADRLIRVTGTLTEHLRELAVSASAAGCSIGFMLSD
jgi:hypothetical protein